MPWIQPDQLRIGLYIDLHLGWDEHPFMFSSFKIKNQKQIDTIKQLKLKQLEWIKEKSDVVPKEAKTAETKDEPIKTVVETPPVTEGNRQREKDVKKRLEHCKQAYNEKVKKLKNILSNFGRPGTNPVEQTDQVVEGIAEDVLKDSNSAVHLVNLKGKEESSYYHSINVTVLCMLVARTMQLEQKYSDILSQAALLHDVGKARLPGKVVRKKGKLSDAEYNLHKMHVQYSLEAVANLELDPLVKLIIAQHHEYLDGSGFPKGIKGKEIHPLSRLFTIINDYDNLCNNMFSGDNMTPCDAIAKIYKQENRFDKKMVRHFINTVGVYPPGTLVELETGQIASVMAVNPEALLLPEVALLDKKGNKDNMALVNLKEADIKIVRSINIAELKKHYTQHNHSEQSINYYAN